MRAGTKVHLTVPGKPSVEIGGGTKNHANLRNLGFEESGHTGFQAALTEEQLKNIEGLANKEDVSNKATYVNFSDSDLDRRYPTVPCMIDYVSQSETTFYETWVSPLEVMGWENSAAIRNLQTNVGDVEKRVPRLIRKITIEEDVASVTISTDEEGNAFALNDFEIRFTGKHSTTMWMGIGKGEKYFCVASIANNNGLPCYNRTADYFIKNVVAHYIYTGFNFCGTRYQQDIGPIVDGKYAAGAGEDASFNTTPTSGDVSTITVQAISGGVINAGAVIEIWGN